MIRGCVRLNKRSVLFILFSYIFNHIKLTATTVNQMDYFSKSTTHKNVSIGRDVTIPPKNDDDLQNCPVNLECNTLNFPCIKCNYNYSCIYGNELTVNCESRHNVNCTGEKNFTRTMICRYCYQTELWEHSCVQKGNCNSAKDTYRTNCTVHPDVLCLGYRTFLKNIKCNWTQGIRWSTALIISITLGGFGADRFYLGHWQEGIGKLFSFGGLGVWTLIDVILISLHYLGPADGSLYI